MRAIGRRVRQYPSALVEGGAVATTPRDDPGGGGEIDVDATGVALPRFWWRCAHRSSSDDEVTAVAPEVPAPSPACRSDPRSGSRRRRGSSRKATIPTRRPASTTGKYWTPWYLIAIAASRTLSALSTLSGRSVEMSLTRWSSRIVSGGTTITPDGRPLRHTHTSWQLPPNGGFEPADTSARH